MDITVIGYTATAGLVWITLHLLYPHLLRFLERKGMYRKNYQGVLIPVAVGLLMPVAQIAAIPFLIAEKQLWPAFGLQAFGLAVISFLGWHDDHLGGDEAKGLRGHFSLWWRKGVVSTGLQKAMGASLLSLIICAIYSSTIIDFFVHFFIVIFSTNLLNLLDLRPGRAIKSFLFLFSLLFLVSYSLFPPLLWLPSLTAALFLLRFDLQGKAMLGDAGSNCLGVLLGYWTVLYAPWEFKWVLLIFLLVIHIYAEKKSITTLIQNTSFLRWLDTLGRKEI